MKKPAKKKSNLKQGTLLNFFQTKSVAPQKSQNAEQLPERSNIENAKEVTENIMCFGEDNQNLCNSKEAGLQKEFKGIDSTSNAPRSVSDTQHIDDRMEAITIDEFHMNSLSYIEDSATQDISMSKSPRIKDNKVMSAHQKHETQGVSSGDDSEDDIIIAAPRQRRRRALEDEEDSDVPTQSPKPIQPSTDNKRRRLTKKPARIDSSPEDTNEELDFLRENDVYQERTRTKKESRYRLALGKLRDRKQRLQSFGGEAGPMDHFCHSGTNSLYPDSDQDVLDEYETASEEGYDEFIVDDDMIDGERLDEAEIPNVTLPDEFSMNSMQKLSYNFRLFVEYLLNEIRTPDTDREDGSNIAVRAIERRVKGYRDSVLTSDAWNLPFKNALDSYTKWTWKSLCDADVECGACRGRKPAKFDVSLSNCLHSRGPKQVIFSVGSGCYKRGQAYHGLTHFRLHMYQRLEEEMRRIVELYPDVVLEEDMLVTNILENMDDSGFVRKLYDKMKTLFASADDNYLGEPDSEPDD